MIVWDSTKSFHLTIASHCLRFQRKFDWN